MSKIMINAWKVDSFMMGIQSVGFPISKLEMKCSDNCKRFGWYYNGVLVAFYNDTKQRGWYDENAECRLATGSGGILCSWYN